MSIMEFKCAQDLAVMSTIYNNILCWGNSP